MSLRPRIDRHRTPWQPYAYMGHAGQRRTRVLRITWRSRSITWETTHTRRDVRWTP